MTTDTLVLTDRQKREKIFYEQYVESFNFQNEIDLSPVKGDEKRPWNSYWAVYDYAQVLYEPGAKLLDFGSGPGENALRFSHLGYSVEGFDICEANIVVSRKLFKKYGKSESGNFQVSTAENLPYPSEYFDFIAGIDILHHVDVKKSLNECRRVLRPGGVAIFREPIEVPLLDWIRNTFIVRAFAPKTKSLDLHITEDERKLNRTDIQIIQEVFPNVQYLHFFLFARFDKFYRKGSDAHPSILEKLDHGLLRLFPFLKAFGGVRLIILKKE
jgi:ubiquinone/menaquinone biosynthesis C-methylase UbiE